MNTVFLLLAEYETSQIPLSVVAEKFLSISPSWADKKANLGELPFPTYRDNQKSESGARKSYFLLKMSINLSIDIYLPRIISLRKLLQTSTLISLFL